MAKMSDVEAMTKVLRAQIVKHSLFTKIQGHNYVHVDGWEFAGGMLGILPRVVEVENLSSKEDKEIKWSAQVEIVDKDGKVVSRGFALCSNKENKKKGFDEYAVLSMAQTRAIGKAYRNVLAWVMKLAGYETTPSEEAQSIGKEQKSPTDAIERANAALAACKSIAELAKVYRSLPPKVREDQEVVDFKNELKKKLS